MERVSELILRNAGRLSAGNLLLINAPRDLCFRSLAESGREVQVFSQDFGDYSWLKSSGCEVEFAVAPCPDPQIEEIILIQPKERARLHMLLHALAVAMPPSARLWLAGENRSGIKSSAKHLDVYFDRVSKVDNARHCTLFEVAMPRAANPFNLDDYETSWSLAGTAGLINIISLPGTFAHGKLDPGTRLLLNCLEEMPISGRVLDFACGSGVIGLSLLSRNPAIEMTLLDTSAPALESARRSLLRNRLKATVLPSDGLSQLEGSFDWIISNPPFHRGVHNDLKVVIDFCEQAGKFLAQKGKILLVCNNHLPYPAWLKTNFTEVDMIKSNREFKVVLASGFRH